MINKIKREYLAAFSGLNRQAWLLSLVVFINRSGSMVLFFMVLYLTGERGFSPADAGRVLSVYGFGALAGSYLGGYLTDRIGPRAVQTVSLALSSIEYIVLGYLDNPYLITAAMFMIALISESFRPANATALAEVCPPELRSRGFALNRLAINLGVSIGPAIGGILASVNYLYLFWIDGLTYFIAMFILLAYVKIDRPASRSHRETSPPKAMSPYRDHLYILILAVMLGIGIIFVQIFNTWPLFLREYFVLSERQIGFLLALNAVLIVLFEMPLVHRLEKSNPLKIMALGALFMTIGFAILPVYSRLIYLALTVFIWTTGEMLLFPFVAGFVSNRANDKNRGSYMGMFSFSFSLSLILGPAIGTWIYETVSAVGLWYIIGGWGVLLSFMLIVIAKKTDHSGSTF